MKMQKRTLGEPPELAKGEKEVAGAYEGQTGRHDLPGALNENKQIRKGKKCMFLDLDPSKSAGGEREKVGAPQSLSPPRVLG